MLSSASVRALPTRPREGLLVAIDVVCGTPSEWQEFILLHRRGGGAEGGAAAWSVVWTVVLSAVGRYEAVVSLLSQPGDRLRLRDSQRVLREWTVDW